MMTGAPMCTTLPACTDWLIMVQHWCHSSHYTSSSLCFPASSSKLSVKLRLLVMVRKIPIVLFFWQTGRRLFPTVPALVKSCNNAVQHLQHPLQLFGGSLQKEKQPFNARQAPLCENRRTETATATLGRSCSVLTTTSHTREDHPPCFF